MTLKGLASRTTLYRESAVERLHRAKDGWWLDLESGKRFGPYGLVCSTAPAPQTARLLPQFQPELLKVQMQPCFAWMLGFPKKPTRLGWEAALVENSLISWMSWGGARPGRDGSSFSLLIHSSNDWAQAHLEDCPDEVEKHLSQALVRATAIDAGTAAHKALHRWRYASTSSNLGQAFLFDPGLGLAACGDWCLESRAEGAFLSARRLLEALERSEYTGIC